MTDGSKAAAKVTCQTGNDERGTPAAVIRRLHDALGGQFGLDPAAGAEPIEIAEERYTRDENGLAQPWDAETVWLNPPYSDLTPWMQKTVAEMKRDDGPSLVLSLLPGNTSTTWFQEYAATSTYLCLVDGRLQFAGTDGSAPFASILCAFGDVPDDVLDELDALGTVYRRETVSAAAEQARLGDLVGDGGAATAPVTGSPGAGLSVSLDRLEPYEPVTLSFDDSGLGAVTDLPDTVTVDVLPDGKTFEADAGEIRVDCLGPNALPGGGDLYVQIRESAYAATRVQVAVSVRGRAWELAAVNRVDAGPGVATPGGGLA